MASLAWFRLRRISVIFCAAIGFLMVLTTLVPLTRWWALRLASPWEDSRGDTLIVLSGSSNDEFVGYNTYLRCQYATMAWREGGFRKVIVSGGPASSPQSLAMKSFLISVGVPESAIVVETRSTSTRENALFTKELVSAADGKLVLLTSEYHTYRAARVFRKIGLNVSPRPIPDISKRSSSFVGRWPAFLDLCAETIKIVYYRARGWM